MHVRRSFALACLAGGALLGCGPKGGSNPPIPGRDGFCPSGDCDGDSYPACDPTSTPGQCDCNDNDPKFHPGAAEICFDHLDQNCDGLPDESCDDDHDGYALVAAAMPNDVPAHAPYPGGDCNDADPLVNPG